MAWSVPLDVLHGMPNRLWQIAPTALVVLFSLAAALLCGVVLALGSPQMNLLVLGLTGGAVLLLLPSATIVGLVLTVALVATGLLLYYAKVGQAHWLVYLLCLLLWLKLPLDALARSHRNAHQTARFTGELFLVLPLAGMLLVVLVGGIHGGAGPLEWLIGARNYIFVWSLAFVLASGALSEPALRRLWWFLLFMAAIQAPFVAVQHVLSAARGVSWDAMVGTFGGSAEGGGGGSGAMAIYLAIMLGAFVVMLKNRMMPTAWGVLGILCCLLAVLMSETKVLLLLAPLAVGLPLLRELRRRPMFALSALAGLALAMAAMFAFYQQTYFANRASVYTVDASDYLRYMFQTDTKLDVVNRETGEVARLAAPLLWWKEGWRDGPTVRLFGYGMRESRHSALLGSGKAARRHAFVLTTSAVSVLLWDTGLLGLLCFCTLLVMLGLRSRTLSKRQDIPAFHRCALEATLGASLVLLVTLMYNDAAVDHHTIQPLLACLVGYVMYWERQIASAAPAPA
jgi:hypothetical protein